MSSIIKNSLRMSLATLMMLSVGFSTVQNNVHAKGARIHLTYHKHTRKQRLHVRKTLGFSSRKYLKKHPRVALKYKYANILLTANDINKHFTKRSNKKLNSLRKTVHKTKGLTKSQRRYLLKEIHEVGNSHITKTLHELTNMKARIKNHHQRHLTKAQERIMKQANYLIRKYKCDEIVVSLATAENADKNTLFAINHNGIVYEN